MFVSLYKDVFLVIFFIYIYIHIYTYTATTGVGSPFLKTNSQAQGWKSRLTRQAMSKLQTSNSCEKKDIEKSQAYTPFK